MRKGKRINIVIQSVDRHGYVTAQVVAAQVLREVAATITVLADDGTAYVVDYNVRDHNGAFVAR